MRAVRSKDTQPELVVRRLAHGLGYRFRLHRKDLPGTPDIVFPGLRSAILVHGCFWHGHEDCSRARRPKTNSQFWNEKIERNRQRDRDNERALAKLGWRILTVWQCETKDRGALCSVLRAFLSGA